MLRGIVLLGMLGFLAYAPLYVLEKSVMPQLMSLKQTYGQLDSLAARAADPNAQ